MAARNFLKVAVYLHRINAEQLAVFVAYEFLARDGIDTGVFAELLRRFFVAVVYAVDFWPQRPGVVVGSFDRRLRHDLEVN
jgi:hypothetical protein